MIITIDGWPGAGKTSLADHMAQTFADRGSTFIVHMDDLYQGWSDPLGAELTHSLEAIAAAHRAAQEFTFNAYDWNNDRPGEEITIPPVDCLILEGVGSGQQAIRDYVETKIWVEIEPIVGLRRVLDRDGAKVVNLDEFEEKMRIFIEQAAAHFAAEATLFAADFEVNGQSNL